MPLYKEIQSAWTKLNAIWEVEIKQIKQLGSNISIGICKIYVDKS